MTHQRILAFFTLFPFLVVGCGVSMWGMAGGQLSDRDVEDVINYLKALDGE